jgi:hypothetical protein
MAPGAAKPFSTECKVEYVANRGHLKLSGSRLEEQNWMEQFTPRVNCLPCDEAVASSMRG